MYQNQWKLQKPLCLLEKVSHAGGWPDTDHMAKHIYCCLSPAAWEMHLWYLLLLKVYKIYPESHLLGLGKNRQRLHSQSVQIIILISVFEMNALKWECQF